MAISSAICSSFKQELLQGKHSFESSGGHTFKIAFLQVQLLWVLLQLTIQLQTRYLIRLDLHILQVVQP